MPQEITQTLNIRADITELESQVKKAQESLRGLSFTKATRESNAQMFVDFKQTFEKINELTQKTKVTPLDVKELEKENDKLNELFAKLQKVMRSEGISDKPLLSYQKAISALKTQQTEFAKATKTASAAATQAHKKEAAELNKLKSATEDVAKARQKYTGVTSKRASLITEKEAADMELRKLKDPRKAGGGFDQRFSAQHIEEYTYALERSETATAALNKANETYLSDLDKTLTELDKTTEAENKARSSWDESAQAARQADADLQKLEGETLQKLKTSLKETGINWDQFGEGF